MRKFNLDWQKGYEEGLRIGIENENNRIIKLIEEEVRYDFPPIIEMSLNAFKALIKGEQK